MSNWRADNNGLSFSSELSNFFHGLEGMQCHITADRNGCSNFIQCQDTNHPAEYMILNSMAGLNNIRTVAFLNSKPPTHHPISSDTAQVIMNM